MKTNTTLIFLFLFFCSCSTINKILVIEDPFKEEMSIKLLQCLDGYSDERKSFFNDKDYYFPIKTIYTKSEHRAGHVILELKLTTMAQPDELDSVIYLLIDEEKYKLVSNDYAMRNYVNSSTSSETSTSTSVEKDEDSNGSSEESEEKVTTSSVSTITTTDRTLQAMKHTFEIPDFLWDKLITSNKIMIRAYIKSEGVDVIFKQKQQVKFSRFFREVDQLEKSTI